MKASHFLDTSDLEHADGYTLLPGNPRSNPDISPSGDRRPIKIFSAIFVSVLLFSSVVILLVNPKLSEYIIRKACLSTKNSNAENFGTLESPKILEPSTGGVAENFGTLGSPKILEPSTRAVAAEKKFRLSRAAAAYPWTNDMLYWQKPGFHFTQNNWMSDPDGPLFHMGWYHLFYQCNPKSVAWGNITWGHAISTDLINWLHLPFAITPDQWYDINGVWGGSATILPDGKIIMLYTGDTDNNVQVQNLAYPENASDPFLLKWVKYSNNPVMVPPPGIGIKDFRDPSTAWVGPDGKWRVTIGSKVNDTGLSLVYKTTDFISYELVDGVLHAVPATGMWECVDFYPVSVNDANGLDTSANGPGVKHVLKSSFDDDKNDYYAIGTSDPIKDKWVPDNPDMDVGLGLRLDYGNYYASKTFYDHDKKRRLLWGWISESDIRSETIDIRRGRASVQGIPRTVVFDKKTGSNILQWPIKEVESLRLKSYEIDGVELKPGELVPIKISSATQLDIVATFEVDENVLEGTFEADEGYSCTDGGGGAGRGVLGPFGIVVLADDSLTELTPVYFYIAKGDNGSAKSYFCADQTRSSAVLDVGIVGIVVYGSEVPVLHGEKYSMRLLVDHSMVESFAQGGRSVITSQVYPTRAIYNSARVFLFNNATGVSVKASVKAWEMASAKLKPSPFD